MFEMILTTVKGLHDEVMIRSVLMKRYLTALGSILVTATLGFGFSLTEIPEGWASQSGGTSGGIGGTEVAVSSMSQLLSEAKSSGKKIIIVSKGTYIGRLSVASDKSIIGKEPGVLIKGSVSISNVSNVILRNFAIKGDSCVSYDACKGGADAMGISSSAHHIWLDHLDVSDGQDGNCDITNGSDFVTVTWCKFWYSYAKEHRYSNLISSADNVAGDKGKLNITYAYCWWADRVDQRMPRGRSGKVHVVNNLYTSREASYACGPGVDIQMLIENNVFNNSGSAIQIFDGTPAPAFKSTGNIGSAKNIEWNQGTVFTPPYTLSLLVDASKVDSIVRPAAGNTLTLAAADVRKTDGTAAARRPYLVPCRTGWALKNPFSSAVTFVVISLDGRIILPTHRIEAKGSFPLPLSGSPFLLRFNGVPVAAADRYVPYIKPN
jgi:pectate lyase